MASLRAQLTNGSDPAANPPSEPRETIAQDETAQSHEAPALKGDDGKSALIVLAFATVLSAFWAGGASAYLWGYFRALGLTRLDPQLIAFAAAIAFVPPLLFIAAGYAFTRAQAMNDAARRLAEVSERLTAVDESAAQGAQRLGRAVRRELDALSAGLDSAYSRMRALEIALEERVAQLEEASARAGVKAESIAQRLNAEREGIEFLAGKIDEVSAQAAETLAGKTAQLKAMIESAGGELKSAGNTLDLQATQFREAAEKAANAPHAAAIELDRHAKAIETVADAAVARAEFVLARQERQRTAMSELLAALKEDAAAFDTVLDRQRSAAEKAAAALTGQALKLDELADQGFRRIDQAMNDVAARSTQAASGFVHDAERVRETAQIAENAIAQLVETMRSAATNAHAEMQEVQHRSASHLAEMLTQETRHLDELAGEGVRRLETAMTQAAQRGNDIAAHFGKDADRVKDMAEGAMHAIAKLVDSLREGATSAKALILDSTAEAQKSAKDYVGEAMGECDRLLRASKAVAEEAERARMVLAKAAQDAERHFVALPGVAAQEAERIRATVRAETEQMLDLSARTLSMLQTRVATRRGQQPEMPAAAAPEPTPEPESMGEGLRGLARRITSPRRRAEDRPRSNYELSAVLAAAESRETKQNLKPGAASALSALQAALSDIAGDLEDLAGETSDPTLWRRYLDGDRGIFVRRLASSIGPDSVNRITELYRDNNRFHEAADSYLEEFEAMLARAREGDRDGFLASTLLTADTGKIYLAIAYALGRLA